MQEPASSIAEDYRRQVGPGQEALPRGERTPRQDAIFKLATALSSFQWLGTLEKRQMIQRAKDITRFGAMNMKALAGSLILEARFDDPIAAVPYREQYEDVLDVLSGKVGEKDKSKQETTKRAYQAQLYRYLKSLRRQQAELEEEVELPPEEELFEEYDLDEL